jgi:hypothetical protein
LTQAAAGNAARLRETRAVEALEQIASAEAVQLLESLAAGTPTARLTGEAIASRDRLKNVRSPQ